MLNRNINKKKATHEAATSSSSKHRKQLKVTIMPSNTIYTGIYKITSPSGKVYIGQSLDINRRLNVHKRANCTNQPRLDRSLKKHGPDNHTFEIIHQCLSEELNYWERYFQDKYDAAGPIGLNCRLTETDDKSGEISDATKENISKAMLKYYEDHPEEIERRSILLKENNHMKNKKHSNISKEKMSNSHLKRYENLEEREKISKANIKRYENPEEREKSSKAQLKRWENPDERKKRSEMMTGKKRGNYKKRKEMTLENKQIQKDAAVKFMTGSIRVTDGILNLYLPAGSEIPERFRKGVTRRKKL